MIPRKNVITVCVEDDVRSDASRAGNKADASTRMVRLYPYDGIWQTVWLEQVPQVYMSDMKLVGDPDNGCAHLEIKINGNAAGHKLTASALYEGKAVGNASAVVSAVRQTYHSIIGGSLVGGGSGQAVRSELSLQGQDQVCDTVQSYFGLRTVMLDGMAFRINGKSVFQRLVLDQGFYPDGSTPRQAMRSPQRYRNSMDSALTAQGSREDVRTALALADRLGIWYGESMRIGA